MYNLIACVSKDVGVRVEGDELCWIMCILWSNFMSILWFSNISLRSDHPFHFNWCDDDEILCHFQKLIKASCWWPFKHSHTLHHYYYYDINKHKSISTSFSSSLSSSSSSPSQDFICHHHHLFTMHWWK